MSEQHGSSPSPSGHFTLSAFGSVQVAEQTTKVGIQLTEAERADFDRTASYFRAHTKDHVLSLDFPSEDDAKVFRAKLRAFNDSRSDVSLGLPKRTPDRFVVTLAVTTLATTDAILAKLAATYDGKPVKVAAKQTDHGYEITLTESTKARGEQIRRDVTSGYGSTDGVTVSEVARIQGSQYPASWNTGANVTFRFGKARDAEQNGTVTTTKVPKIRTKRTK